MIFMSEGVARDQLSIATATGYFGPITAAAFREYQLANGITPTGIYDRETRSSMVNLLASSE